MRAVDPAVMTRTTRTRVLFVGAIALAASALGACSLLTDTNGLTGSSSKPDGGASPDTATSDVVGTDGPVGSSDAGEAGSTRFCADSGHALCADFDVGQLDDGWTRRNVDTEGTVALSTTRAKSPPNALFATLARREANLANAAMEHVFQGWRRTVVEFDAYVEPPAWLNGDINAAIVAVEFHSSTTNFGGYIAAGPDYTGTANQNVPSTIFGRWIHFKLDVEPATGKTELSFEGNVLTSVVAGVTPGGNATTTVGIGIDGYNKPCPAFAVYYDDVTVDFP